jgi:malonate decarboxylase gamma subunit
MVHAMRKASAARITRRTVEELDELGKAIIPMAYDIRQFAKLVLSHELISGIDADAPSAAQIARVKERLAAAIADIRKHSGDLTARLSNDEAGVNRAASIEVRRRLAEQWNAS